MNCTQGGIDMLGDSSPQMGVIFEKGGGFRSCTVAEAIEEFFETNSHQGRAKRKCN